MSFLEIVLRNFNEMFSYRPFFTITSIASISIFVIWYFVQYQRRIRWRRLYRDRPDLRDEMDLRRTNPSKSGSVNYWVFQAVVSGVIGALIGAVFSGHLFF